jgi:hypothetical protein
MAVGFPTKDTFVNGDVYSAGDVNDLAGTVNTIPALIEANAGGQYAAGKNKIINGDFRINQRAFTSTTSAVYGFDRWFSQASGGTVTYSAQTFTLGTAPVAGYEGVNFARIETTSQSAASDRAQLIQRIESVRTLAGETATVSFWAKAASGTPKIAFEIDQSFGSGGSPSSSVRTPAGQVTLSTSWQRYSLTVAIPSINGKTLGTANNDSVAVNFWVSAGSDFNARTGTLGIQSNTFDIWGVQLEAGSTASDFQTATGTIQGELAACQRYYYRATVTTTGQHFGNGNVQDATTALFALPLPVVMRTSPTALEQSGTASDYSVRVGATATTCSGVPTFINATTQVAIVSFQVASGLVAGNGAFPRPNATAAYLGWSAEL